MKVLLINCILTTAEKRVITRRASIKDCMICNFAQGFVALGHQVTILASQEFAPTQSEQYPFEIVFFPSRWPQVFHPSLLPWPIGMRQWLQQHVAEYDMVVSSEVFQLSTLIAAQCCGDKLLIWQEMVRHQRMMHRWPSRIWYRVVPQLFMRDALVVPRSEAAYRFVSHYCHQVSDRFVDHGVDGETFYPDEQSDDSLIVVARLVPGKNISSIVNKFARLLQHEAYKDYRLDIVGDGEQRELLANQAISLSISNHVVFHGYLSHSQMAVLVRRAKALLVDTMNDLNMISIVEAIASGTPIVTNTLPSTSSYIVQHGLGIARDGWNEEDLIQVIRNYEAMHRACVAVRDDVTNVGCAQKMIDIFSQWNHKDA